MAFEASRHDIERDGWAVSEWINSDKPLALPALAGKVVLLHAFQMLCPACVAHGTPQAEKAHRYFPKERVAVIGLHTVFEHHAAMMPVSLKAFVHENRLTFPIGVDARDDRCFPIPATMDHYGMRGTPSLLLFGKDGALKKHVFGQVDDLALGAKISALIAG
jgi:AhpC/TSA family